MALRRRGRRERRRCGEVRRVLQSYLDGELHPVEAVGVADHLTECPSCGMDAADYRLLLRALARLRIELDSRQVADLERAVERLIERGATGTT